MLRSQEKFESMLCDLKSNEQGFQLASKIMLVSMKPNFQICLNIEVISGVEIFCFQSQARNKIYVIYKTLFYYKSEYDSVWLYELVLYENVLRFEDAKRLDPPNKFGTDIILI